MYEDNLFGSNYAKLYDVFRERELESGLKRHSKEIGVPILIPNALVLSKI